MIKLGYEKQKTRGIGGFADVYITEMEVRIGSEEIRTFVGFIEGDIPLLMGRTDFFRTFEVFFKTNEILFIEDDEDENLYSARLDINHLRI